MIQETIKVKTFGGFSISFAGATLQLERNTSTKASHLLQYLISHCDRTFTKEELVAVLYKEDEVSDPVNNLKVNIFRLRKMLVAAGLPQHDYIVYQSGSYGWNKEFPVESDVEEFERLYRRAADSVLPEEQAILWQELLEIYTGDFLPTLRGEEWVAITGVQTQKHYLDALERLCKYHQDREDYAAVMNAARTAAQVCPYEERVYLIQLRCYIAQQRYREAMMLYDEVANMLMNEMGIAPSPELAAIYRRLSDEENDGVANLIEIREYMGEHESLPGAYYCSYPAFIDSCRVLVRMVERTGQTVFLMLSTLKDAKGAPLQASDRLRDAAEAMRTAIRKALRKGDFYTRYSTSQYLVMLWGISRENCQMVADRIEKQFRQHPDSRGVRVKWEFEPATGVNMSGEDIKFTGSGWKE